MQKSCKDFTLIKYSEYKGFSLNFEILKITWYTTYPRTSVSQIIQKTSVLLTNHLNSTYLIRFKVDFMT